MITSWSLRLLTVMTGTLLIASTTTADTNLLTEDTVTEAPQPYISGGTRHFLKGETFSINCTVQTQRNLPVVLMWTIPGSFAKVSNITNENVVRYNHILFNNYTIRNASIEDAGAYTCTSKNGYYSSETIFVKEYLEEPVLDVVKANAKPNPLTITNSLIVRLKVTVTAYPPADIVFLRDFLPFNYSLHDDKALQPLPNNHYTIKIDTNLTTGVSKYVLTIKNLTVEDIANYTLLAKNSYLTKNATFDVRLKAGPKVNFGSESDKKYLQGTQVTLVCEVVGYPLPEVNWIFNTDEDSVIMNKDYQKNIVDSVFKVKSMLEVQSVNVSGNITCQGINENNEHSATRRFLVYEMPDGFGIKNHDEKWFSEGQNVALTCLASKYDFINVTWYGPDAIEIKDVKYPENSLSYTAKLNLDSISVEQAGSYTCIGLRLDESEESESISITVAETRQPVIMDPIDTTEEVLPYYPINFTCTADAVPPPQIDWYKDGEQVKNDSNLEITNYYLDHSTISSMIKIAKMVDDSVGKYECRVISLDIQKSKYFSLLIKEKATHKVTYLSVIGVIFFLLIVLVVYLAWKIRKEKQFRKELAAAGLLNFKEGVTKSINPDLGIDEQAELLPYDEKFEFPSEKLILGKQLGAGAFGVVYKADARGIVNAEETTIVAVKMVKKTADNMYIKALASELKILVHLGKHVNIVNLLGACTKNVGKRELIVIVEYCKYGNIHNYMQKHREVFIDQLTDNPEKNLGKVNRGYSCSSGNSGMHSDYFGSNHTQDTDNTFLNTANTNRSTRKVSETGYIQPEWRSNYESDYSFDGRTPRPLCSRDLLAWAFQIARGMEYLASRKVLHGDLAARNVLLTDDNIVKICDFGLARSIYKNDEYQKQENSPLPVKWLAIECMTDRIFSTQSDVWSFGIVLWELFSLAKTPYPNVSPPSLLQWLSEGHRLEKPSYADDRLYDVMLRCWEQKPNARPTFSQLQQMLGTFLEDNVRNHYVDLNAVYIDMNVKRDGEEDYLAMVCAPDYNNLVTPSPHHYVNDSRSFFPLTPTQLQHDDEGYLQMSPATRQTIFNARAQGTKFDFDARKLTPRVSEANSYGSERTPMLTLNNLPRSGSESDHEGNSSPYLNMCPRIEEETDEVFETKQNNAKNIQPSAVTNPTYITFSVDDEKKPQNYTNSYININVPNGLVK